jgi:ADP-heptose:LPS heptosyltransferase
MWPASHFIRLAELLTKRLPGLRIAIFGGPGTAERQAASTVLHALPSAIDLVGQLSLPEVAACLARCTLFVGNDSGLMHLAASAGTATIGLFGPTPAREYAPVGRRTAFVEAHGLPGAAPMAALEVDMALEAAVNLLREDGALPEQAAQG